MNIEDHICDEIPNSELGILQAMLDDDSFDFPDLEIDLTGALTDTEDEMRVGSGYKMVDRDKFWIETVRRHISKLNQVEYLLYQLRGYKEPEFNVNGLVFSIIYPYAQDLFSEQKRIIPHIRKYCDKELVMSMEEHTCYAEREIELLYDLTIM